MSESGSSRPAIRLRRLLVTGATGFLGRPLVASLLARGYQITACGYRQQQSPFGNGVEFHVGDLSNPADARRLLHPWRWDAVANLAGPAAIHSAGWNETWPVLVAHVDIVLNLMLAVPKGWEGRFVHVSSMTVYGIPHSLPVDESHPQAPLSAYGGAKALAERVVLASGQASDLDCWILRLPGLFSEARRSGALVSFMQSAAEGRPLHVTAREPTPWDILHVNDAVLAIGTSLESQTRNPGPINIGYGNSIELETIAKEIAAWSRHPVTVENIGQVRHPPFQMDIARARALSLCPAATLDRRLNALWRSVSAAIESP